MSAGQKAKFIVKLACIHVQLFTKPHEDYDKYALYSYASFAQIHVNIVTNLNDTSDTSLLRRLQAQTLPHEAPPIGKIHPFTKIALTFEPVMQFGCPLGFKIS